MSGRGIDGSTFEDRDWNKEARDIGGGLKGCDGAKQECALSVVSALFTALLVTVLGFGVCKRIHGECSPCRTRDEDSLVYSLRRILRAYWKIHDSHIDYMPNANTESLDEM